MLHELVHDLHCHEGLFVYSFFLWYKYIIPMNDLPKQPTQLLSIPLAIIVAGAIIGASIYFASTAGSTKTTTQTPQTAGAQNTTPVGITPTVAPTALIDIDDDPMLGNPDAPVTFIEFSDYECPFCQRHFTNTYPLLKKDYIDTGKVKLVFRDLPLSFHNPAATNEAIAANCAREQGGDSIYFKFHEEIFSKTATNGAGLQGTTVTDVAKNLGLNTSVFESCIKDESGKQNTEIQNDIAEAAAAGASATPTFFVGLSTDDGRIDGKRIVGAQPYESVIKPAIEALLAQS